MQTSKAASPSADDTLLIQPKILYYGTPVVLLTTLNEDGSTNISPISSSWALGNHIVLGIGLGGKAAENLQRYRECVINLPDPSLWEQVERLAPTTGKNPVPTEKAAQGFTYQSDKFAASGLASIPSQQVRPARIRECPLQIEAVVEDFRAPAYAPFFAIVETRAVAVHAHRDLIIGEHHIDPRLWSPLIYNFRHYFGLGEPLGKTFRAEV
ncbi:flavin reductase family protein [Paenibacillus sp. DXFW5]|uniref:Flavin reductase family protein n=1 Tax=Paenibacillus rhizolycopersici TaxID=2780073 RepID=A0ABS2H5R8_9BACL|nr:flavin reductase family protein [Paenibacillus rhizolycopersici]MBM6996136.1 flavin reductase family protein [Paenibacillus rhizolycopersici]